MDWYLEALKKYAVFEGRSRRKEYWFFGLFNAIFSVVLVIADVLFGTSGGLSGPGFLSGLYTLGVFLPALAVLVRRLHDTNRSGWWVLFSLIPLVGTIGMTVMMCNKGTEGDNDYGPDPLAVAALDAEPRPQAILKTSTEAPATKVVQQGSMADELKKLSELKDSGILTEAEFEEQKAKLLEAD